jgi:hypothetical protein
MLRMVGSTLETRCGGAKYEVKFGFVAFKSGFQTRLNVIKQKSRIRVNPEVDSHVESGKVVGREYFWVERWRAFAANLGKDVGTNDMFE